jgi:hypothetical protein
MSDNPYQSPTTEARIVGVNSGTREDLVAVARYQKGVLVCILLNILTIFARLLVPPDVAILLTLAMFVVGLAGTIFVVLLAMKVYSTLAGIVVGVLSLVPCINLLVLLIVNGKATSILKRNGIKVGLLGANPSEI